MTVVTSRRDVGFTIVLVSMSDNRTRVCVDTNKYAIFHFAWGMLKTRVSTTKSFLGRRCGSILIWENNVGCY